MIIEGKNVVYEALLSGKTFNKFYALNKLNDDMSNKIIGLAKEKGVKINFCDKRVLDDKSVLNRHQGFVAEVVEFEYCDIDDIISSPASTPAGKIIIILDNIQDPHNLGAIIRTAECAGVDGIVLPYHRSVAVTETVIKSSAGALNNIKISRVNNINTTIEMLKTKNFWIYGAEADGDNLYQTNLKGDICLVVGSEGFGLNKLTRQRCDGVISIPMYGKTNSLNASVATGIVVFEALRQRGV